MHGLGPGSTLGQGTPPRLDSAAVGTRMPRPAVIRADHPFAFAIIDTKTGSPLFIGHVAAPTDTD